MLHDLSILEAMVLKVELRDPDLQMIASLRPEGCKS